MGAPSPGFLRGIDYGTSNTWGGLRWPNGRVRPLLFDGGRVRRMVFTDGISHSVLTGQHALVTTVLIPLANCRLQELAPYQVLARSAA